MIKDFSFGNFRSFKEIQSINLNASKIKEHSDTNIININEKESLLKSKAIYGANASGKSNIVKAFTAFKKIVKLSVKDDSTLNMIDSFKFSTETENSPSFFQLIFVIDNCQYRYGFEATDKEIKSEWLFGRPNQREVGYFKRENNKILEVSSKHFNEGKKLNSLFEDSHDNHEIFRHNSLFLSAVAAMNGKLSKIIINAIDSIVVLSGLEDRTLFKSASGKFDSIKNKQNIINFLKLSDTAISSLTTITVNSDELPISTNSDKYIREMRTNGDTRVILSIHDKYDENYNKIGDAFLPITLSESEGTLKMFELSSFIINAISDGNTIVIDEFDARFHPLISKRIVELFNSNENKNAQLVFITHDTNLLNSDLLRRDQIDFVEKDKYGVSHINSLVEFKGVRNTDSYQRDYIHGKYGAIPFVGDFSKLIRNSDNV